MRDQRFRVSIPVDCSTQDMFLGNRITNISRGGLFLESHKPLPLHSEVEMTFILPELRTAIEAKGRVMWTFDMKKGTMHIVPGSGIRFTEISHEHRSILETYLERLAVATGVSH